MCTRDRYQTKVTLKNKQFGSVMFIHTAALKGQAFMVPLPLTFPIIYTTERL